MRVILDTNVCLDLFVFHDARWAGLLNALNDRSVQAVTRDDCRQEWLIVLNYPHLPLDADSKRQSEMQFDTLISCLPMPEPTLKASPPLPICSDPDDQKFLELALQARADALITKDKALLKLARKNAKAGMFKILSPEAWTQEFAS